MKIYFSILFCVCFRSILVHREYQKPVARFHTINFTLQKTGIACMSTVRSKKEPEQNDSWVLYILECADHTLYTGITNRLEARIEAHENGSGARYTRGRSPLKCVYTECCHNRSDASKRECAVKKLTKRKKLELIKMQQKGTLPAA